MTRSLSDNWSVHTHHWPAELHEFVSKFWITTYVTFAMHGSISETGNICLCLSNVLLPEVHLFLSNLSHESLIQ